MEEAGSQMPWLGGNRAPGQPRAARDEEEEVAEAEAALGREEEEGEEDQPSTSQSCRKRKVSRRGSQAKIVCRQHVKDKSNSTYKALFLRGEDSDVQIRSLGKKWNLHRIYLCQAGYFACMFSGAWRETNMDTIEIQMPDENINREALHKVLGSLYRDVVTIPPCQVVSILATASMLQLDELIQRCGEIMKETVSAQTVCRYCYSAENYGLPGVRSICFQWLLDNVMIQRSEQVLLDVSVDLMKELVSSSELLVMEVEMDVYTMLKRWMFLQLHPTWRSSRGATLSDADSWFARHRRESGVACFLETEQGRAFVPVFQQLRLPFMVSDPSSAEVINRDALIPATWLDPVYKDQWLTVLQADQRQELWHTAKPTLDCLECTMRCGAQLCRDEPCTWMWANFNFGLQLVMSYTNRCIKLCCKALSQSCNLGLSLLRQRKLIYRLRLVSVDRNGRAVFQKDTYYRIIFLRKSQELEVLHLAKQDLVFPIYIACSFLFPH